MTLLSESDVTVKEAMELARHSTPQLTMNTYARTRQDRLSAAVEKMGEKVLSGKKCAKSVYKQAVGAETGGVILLESDSCNEKGGRGTDPRPPELWHLRLEPAQESSWEPWEESPQLFISSS